MKPVWATALAAALFSLAACGEAGSQSAEPVSRAAAAPSCERTKEGEIACLREAFELTGCTMIAPIGSMYKDTGDGGYAHLTAFDVDQACRDEVKASALARGFVEEGAGRFMGRFDGGYDELLTVNAEGVLQWERTQQ